MAEPANLTQAEILARQRMLEEALARQNADAEIFGRMNEPRPPEQPADPSKVVRGIPEAEENPITQILSPLTPFERDVIREPQSTFETIQRYNPGGLDGEAFVEEDVRTSYTPGEYGPTRFATPSIVDSISSGLKFGDRLLFGDDKEQTEARKTVRQGIGSLPELPKAIVESIYGGAENVARGNITTRDAEGNITRPGQFADALTMFPAARAFADVPENSFGIFGGKRGKSGDEAEKVVEDFENQGLDSRQGWENQQNQPKGKYPAYRSSLDKKVRYQIPMENARFLTPATREEIYVRTQEIDKTFTPEQKDKHLLDMQRLRVIQQGGRDYLTVPGFNMLDDYTLRGYGYTKYPSQEGLKSGRGGSKGEPLKKLPDTTLEQIIDFPELFEEYPQLRTYRVIPTPPLMMFTEGFFDSDTKLIGLKAYENTPEGRKEMMSTLMHEIQHAVQDIEGTYSGANLGMFQPEGLTKLETQTRKDRQELERKAVNRLADVGWEKPGNLVFDKVYKFFTGKTPRTNIKKELNREDFNSVKYTFKNWLQEKAQELEDKAAGRPTAAETAVTELNKKIQKLRSEGYEKGLTKEQVERFVENEKNFVGNYGGSQYQLSKLYTQLGDLGFDNAEKLTEFIDNAFDDFLPDLSKIVKNETYAKEQNKNVHLLYKGNPGEVEARNTQLRFEGIDDPETAQFGSSSKFLTIDGETKSPEKAVPSEELIKTFPEDTQAMVSPEEGLIYSLSEGSNKKYMPGERLSMSMDPNDPQMELPGMGGGSGGGRRPPTMPDPAKRLLSKRDGIRGSLDQDTGMKAPTIRRLRKQLGEIEREIFTLRKEAGYPTDRDYAKGGMVTNMNRPVISRGLSNLIRSYSQGPLARLDVPRGTVPVQGMFEGGVPRNFNPFNVPTGGQMTEREKEVQAQMAAEALADDAPLPPIPLNQAQQKAYKAGLLQMDDLGYGRPENNEFMYLGDTGVPATTTVPPQEQGTSGPADTSPIEDSPANPPIQETLQDAPASDPTVPFTSALPVETTTTQPTTTTTQPITTQPTTTQPTTTTTTTSQPSTPPVSLPFKNPNELAEARAAEEAAAAEAERIRLANLAAQEQLAAEQLAAEEAARVAAEAEQQRLLEASAAAEAAAQAEEQERIALDQQLAQELAAQEQAQLAAQQNIDSQVLSAEQLAAQQAADRAANEAAIAAAPMPTAVFQAPTPDTLDRSQFGVPVTPVDMTDPNVTSRTEDNRLDSSHPFYQSEIFKNAPPYGTMDMYTASDGTEFGSSTTGALYEQWLQSQGINPNVDLNVGDMIDPYTSGYAATQGMEIKPTVYPYEGMTQEEMEEQGVYQAKVFQPMPKLTFGSGGEDAGQSQGELVPKLEFGSQKQTGKGRYVTNPVTGQSIWVPDYSNTRGPANLDTRNAESQVGEYGLGDEQQYQCPAYYTLAFEGGQPYCKKIDQSQWPSGGRQRSMVSNLPSRTAVQIIELKEPGGETREGYAQGGPVQNFNYGGFVNRPSLQQQIQQARAQPQGPFAQALFQRFGQYQQQQRQQPTALPDQLPRMPQQHLFQNMQMLQAQQGGQPMPDMLQAGRNKPTHDGPGSMGNPIMDRRALGDIRTRGPDSFTAGFQGGQMGQISLRPSPPPQQIGQVAEPNTQQLASQLQNVTQQVNQLSSHLGVGGGGISQGPSQLNQLQGGIGGLLQNLRPGPPPPQLRATGPVRPPMFQTFR